MGCVKRYLLFQVAVILGTGSYLFCSLSFQTICLSMSLKHIGYQYWNEPHWPNHPQQGQTDGDAFCMIKDTYGQIVWSDRSRNNYDQG